MPSEKDIVKEARALLVSRVIKPNSVMTDAERTANTLFSVHAPDLLRALADEVERLRKQQKAHAEMVDDYYGSR